MPDEFEPAGPCVSIDAFASLKLARPPQSSGMRPRRQLPFPGLPERRRSRVHWGTVLAIVGLGITVMLVIRAVRQPGVSALPVSAPAAPAK